MDDMTTLLPHIKLRFNIEHPSFEECYAHGYQCALADVTEEENPYSVASKEGEQWLEGWWAGFYGEQPLFNPSADIQEETYALHAANDALYIDKIGHFLLKAFEIAGVIAVSVAVGFQMFELVA